MKAVDAAARRRGGGGEAQSLHVSLNPYITGIDPPGRGRPTHLLLPGETRRRSEERHGNGDADETTGRPR
ncbi:hypothetical protein EYF80_047465 [Liparis tanakae]|uniref:Uncharacterized protein n=1 Tax=Liparis tanakae TaxID=230148 RepID=A0A4Z2FNE4_9TELE|nr:hypothetical protein EYF80_047465 [Liparis tanakae]